MERWNQAMSLALAEAAKCGEDVPVGAVLINAAGEVVASGRNNKEVTDDPTGHAEIIAIRQAAASGPVLAFVTASRADVAAWLKEVGFEQYEKPLAPLGGAGLLLQTPASLARLGVLPEHVPLLLKGLKSSCAHNI